MKNLLLILSVILISTLSSFSPVIPIQEIDLFDAISQNLVRVDATSNGKHSGYSVLLTLTNNTSNTLRIHIPGGLNYNPNDNGEQTLIQLHEQFVALKPNEKHDGKIAAFCTEASDRCPSENSRMTITRNKNAGLEQLVDYLKTNNTVTKSAYQDAVWAISDGHSISNIVTETPQDESFRRKIAEITGQKNTWYTSPQNVRIDAAGNFRQETLRISGMLSFTCPKGTEVHQDIHKGNGDVFFASDKTMRAAYGGNIKYEFKLAVQGWERGDYYILIHDGTKELARYEFKV